MIWQQYITISLFCLLPLYIFATEVSSITSKNVTHSKNTVLQVEPKPTNLTQDLTHTGREHVSEKTPYKPVTIANNFPVVNITLKNLNNTVFIHGNKTINTTHAATDLQKNPPSGIVPKNNMKNISNEHINNSLPVSSTTIQNAVTKNNVILTTVTPIIRKPLITVHDDEADKMNSGSKKVPSNIIDIDPVLSEKKHNRSNYVVPIVAIILSVPLVAAVISVLYKKGKDWWSHRDYRRMDYLIEGMYNS